MRVKAFFAFVLVSGMALWAGAGFAEDFSADMVSVSSEGSFTGKIYVSGDKSRIEMPQAVTISRLDKNVTWMLMPSEKMYMEQPINARAAASTQEKIYGEIERIAEGKETVNGMSTTKYRVTSEVAGKRETIFQWIDEGTHFPVKTAAIDNSWSSEFKNIQTGPQDQALFEVPSDYQKMSMDMLSMGN
jgi:outer membrane lipoprotein-sorting protein